MSDAVRHGFKRITIRTVGSIVAVIPVSLFSDIGADEQWLAFGRGKSIRYLSIHDLSNAPVIE